MVYLLAVLAVCWFCDRLYLVQRIADWRTETLAAEADLRARQRRPAPTPRTPVPPSLSDDDIARLCCPLFDPPREDRWMVRRRIREAA